MYLIYIHIHVTAFNNWLLSLCSQFCLVPRLPINKLQWKSSMSERHQIILETSLILIHIELCFRKIKMAAEWQGSNCLIRSNFYSYSKSRNEFLRCPLKPSLSQHQDVRWAVSSVASCGHRPGETGTDAGSEFLDAIPIVDPISDFVLGVLNLLMSVGKQEIKHQLYVHPTGPYTW